jgi:hypothetical protein
MQHLRDFILSERGNYQKLELARHDVQPNKAPGAAEDGLDGWAYMMRTPDKSLAFLYFENKSVLPTLHNFMPGSDYSFQWYHPVTGEWKEKVLIRAEENGALRVPEFPDTNDRPSNDWAAKIVAK